MRVLSVTVADGQFTMSTTAFAKATAVRRSLHTEADDTMGTMNFMAGQSWRITTVGLHFIVPIVFIVPS